MSYEPLFAKYYDYIAHDRREALATAGDISFLTNAFKAKSRRPVRDILDAGCGTGRYLIPLAATGFRVTGLDNSPDMLAHCRARLEDRNLRADLVEMDFMKMGERQGYDAVLCMDSTLCYFTREEDMLTALSLFRQALRPEGLLVAEVFYAAGAGAPENREVHEVKEGDLLLTIEEHQWHENGRPIRHSALHVTVADAGRRHVFSHEEVLRIVKADEMTRCLREAGFMDISVEKREDSLSPQSGDEDLVFLAVKA
jgi:SAM-dependent methyltransferase